MSLGFLRRLQARPISNLYSLNNGAIEGVILHALIPPAGKPELLRPEATANPYLHRLYGLLAARALDSEVGPDAWCIVLSCTDWH